MKFDQFRGCNWQTDPVALPPRASGHTAKTPQAAHSFSAKEDPMHIIKKIESEQLKQDVAEFNVGDTVKV
ncbi:MAG: hypothetical protein WCH43_15200, partial [Verrucomicrobiota bacterium]